MLSRSSLAAGLAALLVAVAASGAFPLPPLPGMFPASAGVDDASSATTIASAASKPPAQMTQAEFIAAANAPRGSKTAAGVVGDASSGFQWDDVLKAGREGKLDLDTNGDLAGSPAGAPAVAVGGGGGGEAAAAAAAAAAPAPASAAVPQARHTPPSQLPVASPSADAAAKSAAAWAEVMAAGRAGTLDPDTTGVKAGKQQQKAGGAATGAPAPAAP